MGAIDERADAVATIIREVCAEAIEPRFGALRTHESANKSPGELVTVADIEAERLLTMRLAGLMPATQVIGEEACANNPGLLDAIGAGQCWLVDPLDGTANFAAGGRDWAVMVAFVIDGSAAMSWIWQPLEQRMYIASRGAGAVCNGEPLRRRPAPERAEAMTGAVLRRFLDPATAARVIARSDRVADLGTGSGAAGIDYPLLVDGVHDFVVFWRTLPWDHAAGALLVEEAGGRVRRPDGSAYRVDQHTGGLVAAADAGSWAVAASLLAPQPST